MNSISSPYRDQETVICRFIRADAPPKVLLDVGVGPKSEYITLSQQYPEMQVIGLEPCPDTFSIVKPKFPGILLPYAAWHEQAELDFFYTKKDLGGASFFVNNKEQLNVVKVQARTLDSLEEEIGNLDRIILWMDIEGSELIALKGAKNLLKSGKIRWINLEVRDYPNRPGACTKAEIDRFLIPFGYHEKLQYNHHHRNTKREHKDIIYLHESELQEWKEIKRN